MKRSIIVCVLVYQAAFSQLFLPEIWVARTISHDTIYCENRPDSSKTTVTFKILAGGDPMCIMPTCRTIFLTENSQSMGRRNPGDRNPAKMTLIQATYNGCIGIIDSLVTIYDTIAHMRFCGIVDTPTLFTNDLNYIKQVMDTTIDGSGTIPRKDNGTKYPGSALYAGIYKAFEYIAENHIDRPKIIVFTLGKDDASGDYGKNYISGMTNLGPTPEQAVDSLRNYIESLRRQGIYVELTIFDFGGVNKDALDSLAENSNGYRHTVDENTDFRTLFPPDAFYECGSYIAGVKISPNIPILQDVLGPDIHYVPDSYTADPGNSFDPAFNVDTIAGYTRLSFEFDTLENGQFAEITYDITASLNSENPVLMRSNNSKLDDSTYYSRVLFETIYDSIIERPLPSQNLYVKPCNSSIDEPVLPGEAGFLVFPNPFNPSVTISIPFTHTCIGLIQIYDIRGKMVFQKHVRGQERIAWNAAGLSNGVYLLKARQGIKVYSRKLLLQR